MVFGLGKKEENPREPVSELPPPPGQPTLGSPTDLVSGMRKQGFTNNQIVQALQRDGYSSDQIFDAMNQADIKTGGQPVQPMPMEAPLAPERPPPQELPQAQPMAPLPPIGGADKEQVEELTEAIIEEKWADLTENIKKVVEWKTKTEAKMDAFEQKIDQMQKSFDELHKAIIGKIGDSIINDTSYSRSANISNIK